MKEALIGRFVAAHSREPEFIARAPGRIEVIGNHTDYNGGPVLGAAIDRGVWVGVSRSADGRRKFASEGRSAAVDLPAGPPERVSGVRSWVNYPLGVLMAIQASGRPVPEGFQYVAVSNLPSGAGLSSSAAIELASALTFLEAAGQRVPREELVALGRRAENDFVGVPCGILDQGVSGFGRKGQLVHIDCRGPRFRNVPLPDGANFWIFNTHSKHALVDGLYAERHRECMEAARVIGVPLLADATPAMLAAAETRLSRAAYKRARHVIDEIARVEQAVGALGQGDLPALGKLLYASHRSSHSWFENSTAELDFLVAALEGEKGVFGARLTGGGFGGAVMALTSGEFGDAAGRRVADAYLSRFGSRPDVLHALTDDGAELLKGSQ
jgi:galactokinase